MITNTKMTKDNIDGIYLHTNTIKTSKLDNIRLDNGSTMTIQADSCNISRSSKGTLKTDMAGSLQTFETRWDEGGTSWLSIVPKNGTLDVKESIVYAYINKNSGNIKSSGRGSYVDIDGANDVSLEVLEKVELRYTSNVILDNLSDGESGISPNAKIEFQVGNSGTVYSGIYGENTCPKVGTNMGFDGGFTKTSAIKLQSIEKDACPYKVTGIAWYKTTFELI